MAAALLAAMTTGCSDGGASGSASELVADEPVSAEVIDKGKSVYLMRCVGCHALDGTGIVGPDIRPGKILDKYSSATAMEVVVRDGLGEMPEFASKLSEAEIAAVAAYVRAGLG